MTPEQKHIIDQIKTIFAALLAWLRLTFDRLATWATQMPWWKFIIVTILIMMAGGILQDTLFPPQTKYVAIKKNSHGHGKSKTIVDRDTNIRIDSNGITITKNAAADAAKPAPGADNAAIPSEPPVPPAPPTVAMSGDIHIKLPPEIGQEVSDAIDEAVDDAAAEKSEDYRKESSKWFMNFVMVFIVGMFITKILMGGKKRAEINAAAAQRNAEHEALQRQVSEAKMHMMQAQVEPHFLFNTLASVEHLIETDPPRASAMQRKLIAYLRAVLPQIRGSGAVTNLGREADMAQAYLELLKMRMEERLHVDFQISNGLRSAVFPPMMLQPLVENAIKHGLEGKPEGGTLKILAEVVNGKLQVSVSDDGLGFGALPSDGTGIGLQSIRERLKLLHSGQSQLIITPNYPSGVKATIEVPYLVSAA